MDKEILYLIKKCNPIMVIFEECFIEKYNNFSNLEEWKIKDFLVVRAPGKKFGHFDNFNDLIDNEAKILKKDIEIFHNDVVEILFTSGTTSMPKGVEITQYNILFSGMYTSWQGKINSKDNYLTVMPIWHIDFQCTAAMPTFYTGATLILLEKYSATKYWSQVCLHRATVTEAIPKIIHTLMVQPKKDWEQNHCLREIFYYLSMDEKSKENFLKRFNVKLLTSYGMTETIVGAIGDRPGEKRVWPSLGRVGFTYEVKIINNKNEEVPCGVHGELCIKGIPGRNIFKGYYKDPEATKKVLNEEGWLKTGDRAYIDKEGYIYFVDRKINLIKVSGENVSSIEIEIFLTSNEKIAEAAIVGIPDKFSDEAIKAFIVVEKNKKITKNEIFNYCKNGLAKFKIPSVIEIVEQLPRTSTGKIKKNILKNS